MVSNVCFTAGSILVTEKFGGPNSGCPLFGFISKSIDLTNILLQVKIKNVMGIAVGPKTLLSN